MVSKNPSADEVQRWGPGEVAEWLAQVGLEECVRFFQARNVTGAELLTLDESALFRWQDLPIKMRRDVAKQIETLKSRKQEKKSKFSLFSKKQPELPSRDYHHEPTSPDDDDGWASDEFDDTLTAGSTIEWQECLDDNGFRYYWNITTNETSWDRPDKFNPVESGTLEFEEEEDGINDYEPPPDDVSPKHTQPPHRRQPMPLPTESTDQDTYEIPDHDNESGGSDYEEPVEDQQPPVLPHRPHQVKTPAQQTRTPVRANNFNVNVADRRMPPLPGRQLKPAPASQPEDMYEEFAENAGPEEEYEMPVQGQGGPEEEYEVPDSESFPSGRLPPSTGPPVLGRKPLPPPPDEEPPPALPPKPTKPGPTSHISAMNKVLPGPTPDSRQAPKVPTSAKSAKPPPLPSPSTKPESPFTGGPPQFPTKKPQVTSPLASGQKSGTKWPPADESSNVRPSQLKKSDESSNVRPSQLKNVGKPLQTSSPPQPSRPKWKQTPPAVPSQTKPAGVSSIASKFEAKQELTPPKSPGLVKNKVSGLTSMFEKQNLHLSPVSSPPLGGTKSSHRSPRTSTLSVASTTSSSSAASSDLDKRASHSSASSASGDSIHDELLPGQRPGGPGGVPPLPNRGKSGAPPPPPPITSIPSTKAKTRDMRSRQLPVPPSAGGRGPPPPPQAKKPVPSVPLPEPDPEPLQGGLYEFPWYHGEVEQKQASAALREHGKDGAFLIRKSTKDPTRPYTLALIYQKAIKKVQIRYRPDQKYALGTEKEDEDTFYSVPDLIEFHQTHDILLSQGGKTKLTEAVFKNY